MYCFCTHIGAVIIILLGLCDRTFVHIHISFSADISTNDRLKRLMKKFDLVSRESLPITHVLDLHENTKNFNMRVN